MPKSRILAATIGLMLLLGITGCNSNPQPVGLTSVPSLAVASTPTLISVLPTSLPRVAQPTPGGGSEAALGAAIYQNHCSTCHGVQGEGVDGPALRNSQYVRTAGYQEVYDTIANGRAETKMPAWLQDNGGPLSADQIRTIFSFLQTLQKVSILPTATPAPEEEPAEAPGAGGPTPEPARPSIEGDPGEAAAMTGDAAAGRVLFGSVCAACHGPEGADEVGLPNPGSEDGIVPPLNPIDPSMISQDPMTFATNIDLFLEHGSVPAGPSPRLMMPAFGDSQMLSDTQLADLITYVMYMNGVDR
jgi:mono/diheme cytochrome c family protein